jgi:hypothetical protein
MGLSHYKILDNVSQRVKNAPNAGTLLEWDFKS